MFSMSLGMLFHTMEISLILKIKMKLLNTFLLPFLILYLKRYKYAV